MATAPLSVARTTCDSCWKCHWSPVSLLVATKMPEVSAQGGVHPPARLRNGLGVISAALHSNTQPFRDGALFVGSRRDSGEKQHCFSARWLSQHGNS